MSPVDPFQEGLDFFLSPNYDGHINDRAPGEAFNTVEGITDYTWANAVKAGVVSGTLANSTHEQRLSIYRVFYYNALHCSQMPPGLAFAAFVDATLVGAGHVAYLIQRLVGAKQDGAIGPETIADINTYIANHSYTKDNIAGEDALIDVFITADEQYEAACKQAGQDLKGWTTREENERKRAHLIAAMAKPAL